MMSDGVYETAVVLLNPRIQGTTIAVRGHLVATLLCLNLKKYIYEVIARHVLSPHSLQSPVHFYKTHFFHYNLRVTMNLW